MNLFGRFRELDLWKCSMELVVEVYTLTRKLPEHERFGLVSQMQRAAVSVPSNIAEGYGREHTKELIKFLYVSRGSLMELSTQMEISVKLGYLSESDLKQFESLSNTVHKLLNGLIFSLKKTVK